MYRRNNIFLRFASKNCREMSNNLTGELFYFSRFYPIS